MHGATDYRGYQVGGLKVFAARSDEHIRGAAGRPRRLNSGHARLVAEIWPGPERTDRQSAAQNAEGPSDNAHEELRTLCSGGHGREQLWET